MHNVKPIHRHTVPFISYLPTAPKSLAIKINWIPINVWRLLLGAGQGSNQKKQTNETTTTTNNLIPSTRNSAVLTSQWWRAGAAGSFRTISYTDLLLPRCIVSGLESRSRTGKVRPHWSTYSPTGTVIRKASLLPARWAGICVGSRCLLAFTIVSFSPRCFW